MYRMVLLGTTGAGKSQLCNFIIQDKTNTTFKVSNSFNSETQKPQSKKCIRSGINIDIIDTAGCCDSGGKDNENFKVLIDYLREKKSISLFVIVINFTQRLDEKTREYISFLSQTFTPTEFYNHLAIVFTHYKEEPSKKDKEKLNKKSNEIKHILKEIIGVSEGETSPQVYELDTQTDDDDNFIEKFQTTIDVIILKMKNISLAFGNVCTESIKFNGVKDRLEEERKIIEEGKKKMEEEKRKMEEDKRRMEEKEKLIKEQLKKTEEERKKAKEDKKKSEEEQKKFEVEIQKKIKELEIKQQKIDNQRKQQEEENQKEREKTQQILDEINENKRKMQELQDNFDIKIRDLNSLIKKEEERKKQGIFFTVLGTILSCTVILAPIGIPMAIVGTIERDDAGEKIEKLSKQRKNQRDHFEEEYKRLQK
jgi:predicted GTPase